MNRENKRKTFEKGYYKTHACNDTFTCKVCGRVCTPQNAGSDHRNHCPNCLSSLHVDEEPGDRASDCGGIMSIAMKPLCSPPFPLDYLEEMTALMGGDGRMR